MPIFEYACQDCGHEFEALTRSSQEPECPRCHSIQLAKKLSVFATAGAAEGKAAEAAAAAGPSRPCGTCGHPAGPGACAWQ
jgi:putative FmdB family regulatory protein